MRKDIFKVMLALPDRSVVVIHNKKKTVFHKVFMTTRIKRLLNGGELAYYTGWFHDGEIELGKRLINQEWE
jgi:hypothetical protein